MNLFYNLLRIILKSKKLITNSYPTLGDTMRFG